MKRGHRFERKVISVLLFIFLCASLACAQDMTEQIIELMSMIICALVGVLIFIAGGIAIVIIILNGIKWTSSSDDPGARKAAKMGIIHAIVGLLLVLIAVEVVGLVTGSVDLTSMTMGC